MRTPRDISLVCRYRFKVALRCPLLKMSAHRWQHVCFPTLSATHTKPWIHSSCLEGSSSPANVPSHAQGRRRLLASHSLRGPQTLFPGSTGLPPSCPSCLCSVPTDKEAPGPNAAGPCPPWPSYVALASPSCTGRCISLLSVSPVRCHISRTHTQGPSGAWGHDEAVLVASGVWRCLFHSRLGYVSSSSLSSS